MYAGATGPIRVSLARMSFRVPLTRMSFPPRGPGVAPAKGSLFATCMWIANTYMYWQRVYVQTQHVYLLARCSESHEARITSLVRERTGHTSESQSHGPTRAPHYPPHGPQATSDSEGRQAPTQRST